MSEMHADLPQTNPDRPDQSRFEPTAFPHHSTPPDVPPRVPDDLGGKSFARRLESQERMKALEASLEAANDPVEKQLLGDILRHYCVWYERTRGL